MILSQKKIEEIAVAVTKDFNEFFFGSETKDIRRMARGTPIDQFAKEYLGLEVSFAHLSPDGSICGLTAYADTEYITEEMGVKRTIPLRKKSNSDGHQLYSTRTSPKALRQETLYPCP